MASERLRIREAVVVEGRYDKHALAQVVDTVIVETGGFGVFHREDLLSLIRRLAEQRGVILLTDSDGAGFVIRNRLKGSLPPDRVKQAYIPDRFGKERRKRVPGREGKLGVEGMSPAVLRQALLNAGATVLEAPEAENAAPPLTKADLYAAGLAGGRDSAHKRSALLRRLELPEHLSANALLEVLRALYPGDGGRQALARCLEENEPQAGTP